MLSFRPLLQQVVILRQAIDRLVPMSMRSRITPYGIARRDAVILILLSFLFDAQNYLSNVFSNVSPKALDKLNAIRWPFIQTPCCKCQMAS